MKTSIFYNKTTGEPVQIITRAQTIPAYQEVVCYQELTKPFDCFVMETRHFFAEYVKDFEELPIQSQQQIEKRQDLPEKQPRISKGEVTDPKIQKMVAFFDAETYKEKIRILQEMKDDLDEHILNNLAVSLDLSIEDGVDGYEFIMSELRIRAKYETARGERF